LAKAAKANGVLNGTAPPTDSPWGQIGIPGTGWTLLCPTDDAFKRVNRTRLYSEGSDAGQHLLHTPNSAELGPPKNN